MPGFEDKQEWTEIKYRIREPGEFVKDSFRTKSIDSGVNLILGKRESDGSMIAQALRFKKPQYTMEKAKQWVSKHKDSFEIEPQELFSAKGIEIFSVGNWNGKDITQKDIDNILSAFNETKDKYSPPLKLGHNDEQKLLQTEGLPAAGYINNLYTKGGKLVADIVDVPRKIYQLIKNKAYKKVSCEIYNNLDFCGKKYSKFLGALSLLGDQMPGVLNLDDILALYKKDIDFQKATFADQSELDIIDLDKQNLIVRDKMPEKDQTLELENEKLKNKLDKFENEKKAEKEKYDKLQEKNKALQKEIEDSRLKTRNAEIEKFVSDLKAEKLCTPAMEGFVKELLAQDKEKYTFNDKEYTKEDILKETLKLCFEAGSVNFDETTHGKGNKKLHDEVEKVEKFAKDNDIKDFSKAYREYMKQKNEEK